MNPRPSKCEQISKTFPKLERIVHITFEERRLTQIDVLPDWYYFHSRNAAAEIIDCFPDIEFRYSLLLEPKPVSSFLKQQQNATANYRRSLFIENITNKSSFHCTDTLLVIFANKTFYKAKHILIATSDVAHRGHKRKQKRTSKGLPERGGNLREYVKNGNKNLSRW